VPANAVQALAYARAGLAYLATADPAELTGAERADVLRGLAAAESQHLAARSAVLAAYDRCNDHDADGQPTSRSWLVWQARITRAAAGAAMAWMRRLAAHPSVHAALASGAISLSWARHITDWSDQLPEDARDKSDKILLDAAAGGADLTDLAALAEELRRRTAGPDSDEGDGGFADRALTLTPHFRDNARLDGDLTPDAAAAVQAVLDALGGRAGPEDTRSRAQRHHDALAEACRRLIAAGELPGRAGQPTQIQLHMTLSQLLGQSEADPAAAAWIAANGAPAPPGADCDAAVTPIVTGTVDPGILDQLAAILLDGSAESGRVPDGTRLGNAGLSGAGVSDAGLPGSTALGSIGLGGIGLGGIGFDGITDPGTGTTFTTDMMISAIRQLAIGHAVRLLSGPGGLASWLRTSQLDGLAASVSLPLDIGATTDTIPVHLRRAIGRRDAHCRFPGCHQPAAACHVHHLVPRSEGGATSIDNCCLVCAFHHLVAIHRWSWRLALNPDGTTIATSPDGDRTSHSHAPPVAA
jgi:hypothetical protein